MRSLPRAFSLALAFAAPSLIFACGLSPITPPTGTSSSTTTSSSTGGTGGHGGSVSTVTSSTTGSTGPGGHGGAGGATSSSSAGGSGGSGGAASSSASGGAGGATSSSSAGSGGGPSDGGTCNTTVTKFAVDPSPHVLTCFPVAYSTNPPTSGPHYPYWAAFQTYTTPVPRGFYVHDLEHGAIVITYNCPAGCDAELAQLQSFLDARPMDLTCQAPVRWRYVVTPDPLLDVRFAASAWGWALKSDCFDLDQLGPFIDAHYAQASENLCANGTDVTAADAGIPADCGKGDGGM